MRDPQCLVPLHAGTRKLPQNDCQENVVGDTLEKYVIRIAIVGI